MNRPQRVILDCDPGNGFVGSDIDDGLALGLIIKSDELILEAVTITSGNTHVDKGVRASLALIEKSGLDIPVFRGAEQPLIADDAPWREALDHGGGRDSAKALWRDIVEPRPASLPGLESAAESIVRIVREYPGEVTIIAIGPLTNIALALSIDSGLSALLRRIVIMGGCFGAENVVQEVNFGYDPEAAHIVMNSGAPITLIPLDATLGTSFTLSDNQCLIDSHDPLVRELGETCQPWIRFMETRGQEGCELNDPIAVVRLLNPSIMEFRTACVDVETHGHLTRGRAVSWDPEDTAMRPGVSLPNLEPIEIVTNVDNRSLVQFILERLTT